MIVGGVTALITAIALGGAFYGNRDAQIVSVSTVSDLESSPVSAHELRESPRAPRVIIEQPKKSAFVEKVITVEAGDTFIEILLDTGLPNQEAYAAAVAMAEIYDPRDLRAGQKLKLFVREPGGEDKDQCFEKLEFVPETDRLIAIEHDTQHSFFVRDEILPHFSGLVAKSGIINSSFFKAARAVDVPVSVLFASYGTLSHALDFQRDFRPGDTFEIGFNVFDDGPERGQHPGKLVYASFRFQEKSVRAYRYTTSDGDTGFFDESGASLSTNLMKTPIDGARLSSLFGKRNHPILGYTRMHRGLDFAASRGTPVVAAGDGIVVQRGRNGDFGKYIRIKHDETYSTAYAHLSRYVDGLKPGDRIRQSEVIGYVGSTGLVTGPNLHYEVLKGRRQINPLKLKLPPRRMLKGQELARFEKEKQKIRSLLELSSSSERSRRATSKLSLQKKS